MEIQKIKERFGIIGNSIGLNRAIDIARQVSPTDLSVLIVGESGTGKEIFPQIIHQYSARKHGTYIAVNCGAIPEGTIDSELYGHEKGSFTGAHEKRKGYFEVADGGTIFLDEVADLPLFTQVRLLRVLETGEFMKVGSSITQKTNVRVIAATNINIPQAIADGRFREDLYYRLNTVPIQVPPLRERKEDIEFLFRKFATDFAERYRMPAIRLDEAAMAIFKNYKFPGNIRQLKNITEQMSIIEQDRLISLEKIRQYLPDIDSHKLPMIYKNADDKAFASEREILYKVLFDMRNDMTELKKLVYDMIRKGPENVRYQEDQRSYIQKLFSEVSTSPQAQTIETIQDTTMQIQDTEEVVEESLSISSAESELIRKALERHRGKRKLAADELGISERTLYRKIHEYGIE